MQDMNNGSKGARGSSPPFQEPERWIEDGAGGSHWVKMSSVNSGQLVNRVRDSLDAESGGEPVRRWENDGGNSTPSVKQDTDK